MGNVTEKRNLVIGVAIIAMLALILGVCGYMLRNQATISTIIGLLVVFDIICIPLFVGYYGVKRKVTFSSATLNLCAVVLFAILFSQLIGGIIGGAIGGIIGFASVYLIIGGKKPFEEKRIANRVGWTLITISILGILALVGMIIRNLIVFGI